MIRFMLLFVLSAGLVAGAGLRAPTAAQDKTTNAKVDVKDQAQPEMTVEEKAVLAFDSAIQMARTGREMKSPVLLLAAAKVIGSTNVRKFDAKLNEKLPGEDYDPIGEAGKLLDEAVALAPKDEVVKALAQQTKKEIAEVKRGQFVGGGKWRHGHFPPGDHRDTFHIHYRSGEHARIFVNNRTNRGDLNLFVFDPHGRLVASDTRWDDDCRVWFPAAHHGVYRVVIQKHHGAHHKTINYTIGTS